MVDLKVAVVTEGIAGIADIADDIVLVDPLALADGDGAHVGVQGGGAVAVVDDHVVAIGVVTGRGDQSSEPFAVMTLPERDATICVPRLAGISMP